MPVAKGRPKPCSAAKPRSASAPWAAQRWSNSSFRSPARPKDRWRSPLQPPTVSARTAWNPFLGTTGRRTAAPPPCCLAAQPLRQWLFGRRHLCGGLPLCGHCSGCRPGPLDRSFQMPGLRALRRSLSQSSYPPGNVERSTALPGESIGLPGALPPEMSRPDRCPALYRPSGQDRDGRALVTIKMRNPLPLTVGRTCPHPVRTSAAETSPTRGSPSDIFERHLGQWELEAAGGVAVTGHFARHRPTGGRGRRRPGRSLLCLFSAAAARTSASLFRGQNPSGRHAGGTAFLNTDCPGMWWIGRSRGSWSWGWWLERKRLLGRDFTLTELQQDGFCGRFFSASAPGTSPLYASPGEAVEGVWPSLDFLSQVGTGALGGSQARSVWW